MRSGFVIYASPIVNPKTRSIDYRCTICNAVYDNLEATCECWKNHICKIE